MDTFCNAVINELREKKYSEGYVWVFNQYNIFRSKLTPQLSLEDFFSKMDKYDFSSMPSFELTEKGEDLLYRSDC